MADLVIIPAHNEEKNLPGVIAEIRVALPNFTIVVVDDGSRDRTAEIARSLDAHCISHPVNIGYGAAVQTGLRYACSCCGWSVLVLMDADGQHDANDAPKLVQGLADHKADVVIGSRFLGSKKYKTTIAREVGRNLFSLITYLITHKSLIDITSGFQALNPRAVEFLSRNYPVDFPDAEVIILLLLSGFKVAEAPANFRQRTIGESMFSFSRKIYYPFKGVLAIFIVLLRVMFKKEG